MGKSFKDKTVLITGASSGFGEAFAKAFAAEGASLINIARRAERLFELESHLKDLYQTKILSIPLDISDFEAVANSLRNLEEPFNCPDVLINNAGMVRGLKPLWEVQPKEWDEMIDINVKGLLNVSSQIIPKMIKANKGHIINVGSVAGHEAYPGGSIYCATKSAVHAITEALRKELVAKPIRVSLISPGMAQTEFSLVRFSGDKKRADAVYENIEPLKAEDIAEIVLFMASRPPHVNIADVVAYPTNQASVSLVHRR